MDTAFATALMLPQTAVAANVSLKQPIMAFYITTRTAVGADVSRF
jgi:hypothetical protein